MTTAEDRALLRRYHEQGDIAARDQLIEQYTRVLLPSQETLAQLKERAEVGAKWKMLDVARKHAKWEQKKREQEKKREDDREAERSAFSVPSAPPIFSLTFRVLSPRLCAAAVTSYVLVLTDG